MAGLTIRQPDEFSQQRLSQLASGNFPPTSKQFVNYANHDARLPAAEAGGNTRQACPPAGPGAHLR